MMKKNICIAYFAALALCLHAQAPRPAVAVLPFAADGDAREEARTIENLVQSYVAEIDAYRSISNAERDRLLLEIGGETTYRADRKLLGELLSADILLSGSVGAVGDNRVLTLEADIPSRGEKKSYSSVYSGMRELALGARALVRRILNAPDAAGAEDQAEAPEQMAEDRIVGTWRGDKGIELVRLYRSGTGSAILSSGVQMELAYSISGGNLKVRQTSPNMDRFYHPVPYAVAVQLVNKARPMEWVLRLYAGGSVLRGTKYSTAVRYEGDTILELIHGSERDAEWTKMTR